MLFTSLDWVVTIFLLLGVLQGILVGLIFLLRPSGNKKANTFFAILMGVTSLSLLNLVLVRQEIVTWLPIWLSLSFGPCFFYFVKFSLFPSYELRWTDAKHFVLPLWQFVFAFLNRFIDHTGWHNFVEFFYRNFEHVLFVVTFLMYLLLAYRYVRYKLAVSRHQGYAWEVQKINQLRRLIRVVVILVGSYGFLLMTDFVVFYLFQLNLHQVTGFAYFSDVCFAGIVYWLGYNGYKTEFFHATAKNKKGNAFDLVQIRSKIQQQKLYLDPELKPSHLAAALVTSPAMIRQTIQQETGQSFSDFINQYRIEEVKKRLVHPRFAHYNVLSIGLEAGFSSKAKFYTTFKDCTGCSPQVYKQQYASEQLQK